MKGSSLLRKAVCLYLIFAAAEIDQSVSVKDGGKGQPEMLQPLDNHPMDWTVDEKDGPGAAVAADSYRYLLMQRTNALLNEALSMSERVKDSRSRQWLEAFINKMSELASDLGGRPQVRKVQMPTSSSSSILPVSQASVPTEVSVKPEKDIPSYQVTSSQLNDVLPVNEGALHKQVVTRPGMTADILGDEDELVHQLHDQEKWRRQEQENKLKASNAVHNPHYLSDYIEDAIKGATQEDEKQLLPDLAKQLNQLLQMDREKKQRTKDQQNTADFMDSTNSQYRKDHMDEDDMHSLSGRNGYHAKEKMHRTIYNFPITTTTPEVNQQRQPEVNQQRQPEINQQRHMPKNSGNNVLNHRVDLKKQEQAVLDETSEPKKLDDTKWLFPHAVKYSHDGEDKQNLRSIENKPLQNYYYYSDSGKLNNEDSQTEKHNRIYESRQSESDLTTPPISNIQKSRHPMLQEMLLRNHGHNLYQQHPGLQRNSESPKQMTGTNIKVQNHTRFEPASEINTISQNTIKNKAFMSNSEENSMIQSPLKQDSPRINAPYLNVNKAPNAQQKTSQLNVKPKHTGFHLDQLSFPDALKSNPQLQHNMERQLRAGKVVIVSDSLVRTNFSKNPVKDDKITPQNTHNYRKANIANKSIH